MATQAQPYWQWMRCQIVNQVTLRLPGEGAGTLALKTRTSSLKAYPKVNGCLGYFAKGPMKAGSYPGLHQVGGSPKTLL